MKTKLYGAVCGLFALSAMAQVQKRPNVILLVADDLGYGDLSCYGAQRIQTPTVDSLAARGLQLTNMHACAATSTPSRYALLTGQYPWRRSGTDIAPGDEAMIINPTQYTLPRMFQEAGYATAAIGKWHLGLGSQRGKQDWNGTLDLTPKALGFDEHYLMAATADRVPCVFIENGRVANYDASAPISVSYRKNFEGEPTGKSNPELLKLLPSHGHDMSIVNGISRIGYMKGGGKALWRDEDIADSIVTHACRFIDKHQEKPFFLYLCTNDVHVPRYPHERFRGKSPMGLRGEAILQFDWTVAQLTAFLKAKGLDKNTVLIITSDNGPVLDDGYRDEAWKLAGTHNPSGPFRGGKYSSYEGGTAVPYIVYWPKGIREPKKRSSLASQIDIPRSLAALIDYKIPKTAFPDSRKQLSILKNGYIATRKYVFTMPSNRSVDVRTKQWKFIPFSKGAAEAWQTHIETGYGQPNQLYSFQRTRYEGYNLAKEYPNVVKKLQKVLNEMWHSSEQY